MQLPTNTSKAPCVVNLETKNEAFLRLATKRTKRVLKDLSLLKNLGSNNYENTQEQADAIVSAIQGVLDEVAAALEVHVEQEFKLPIQ